MREGGDWKRKSCSSGYAQKKVRAKNERLLSVKDLEWWERGICRVLGRVSRLGIDCEAGSCGTGVHQFAHVTRGSVRHTLIHCPDSTLARPSVRKILCLQDSATSEYRMEVWSESAS